MAMDRWEEFSAGKKVVRSIFMISNDGTPVLLRNYDEGSTLKEKEALFAGFFSAIKAFSQTALKKDIRDIQMGKSKYFFVSSSESLLVLEMDYRSIIGVDEEETERIINNLVDSIRVTIELFKGLYGEDVSIGGVDENSLRDLCNAIDALVFEAEIEFSNYYVGNDDRYGLSVPQKHLGSLRS